MTGNQQHKPQRWFLGWASRSATALALVSAVAVSAGCANKRPVITHKVPLSYDQRHPINIGQERRDLAIVPSPADQGMTAADRTTLVGFLRAYRNNAETVLQVLTPSGTPTEALTHSIVGEIRSLAAGEGIAEQNLYIYPYDAGGDVLAPVRLSYSRFAASAGDCGHWPAVNSGNPQNIDYHNFGCATQSNLARMVADPRDLTGPRAETPADANRRRVVFEKYRAGKDTATKRDNKNAGKASKVSN